MVLSFFSAFFDCGCTLTEPDDPSNLLFTWHKKEMIDFVQNMYPGLPGFIGLWVILCLVFLINCQKNFFGHKQIFISISWH